MKRIFLFAATFALLLCASATRAQNLDANGALPRAIPETVGVDSNVIAKTIKDLDEKFNRVDGVMILRDGKVIGEAWRAPNGPTIPHALYSLSKSFCSTAVGFAVSEGKLSVDQKMVEFFPEDLPENPDPRLKDVRVKDLLTMSCGHANEPMPPEMIATTYGLQPILSDEKPTWVQRFLAHKIEYEPGEHFMYNTTGTYMCSAIVQKAVGEKIVDYLQPRLFDPLHIDPPYWEESPQGINKGGTGLFLKTEDIAKFGQLLLQKGMWNGEQLIPAAWIDEATTGHVSNGSNPESDWAQGYGYQFWRCRHNCYRGDGMYSQFCFVMPDQNIVVAINSDCNNYQGILNVLFDNLLAIQGSDALPENPAAYAALQEVEKSLQPKEGESGSGVVSLTIPSAAMKRDVNYRVYIPNGYRTTSFYYPVIYLLHGLYGSEKDWSEQGQMQAICDEYFKAHPEQKSIVVMPDGGNLWYRDSVDDSAKFETFFFNELIPDVERRFRCKTDATNRAITGLSMGGYGSLLYALRPPDKFCACYAMSAGLATKDELEKAPAERFLLVFRQAADQKEDGARFDDYFFANDPFTLVANLSPEQKKALPLFLDCGDDDWLLPANIEFFKLARLTGASCELRVRDGGHTWEYWRSALPMALEFFGQHMGRNK